MCGGAIRAQLPWKKQAQDDATQRRRHREMEKAKGKRSAPRGRRAEWGDGTPQERSAENVPFGLLAEFCPLRKLSHASCLFNATECNWLCTGKVTKHATAQRAQPSAFSDTRPDCLACLIATQCATNSQCPRRPDEELLWRRALLIYHLPPVRFKHMQPDDLGKRARQVEVVHCDLADTASCAAGGFANRQC